MVFDGLPVLEGLDVLVDFVGFGLASSDDSVEVDAGVVSSDWSLLDELSGAAED
jgi:hypothetical protein